MVQRGWFWQMRLVQLSDYERAEATGHEPKKEFYIPRNAKDATTKVAFFNMPDRPHAVFL